MAVEVLSFKASPEAPAQTQGLDVRSRGQWITVSACKGAVGFASAEWRRAHLAPLPFSLGFLFFSSLLG